MSFIPHTQHDIKEMLRIIGVKNIDELFDEIPSSLLHAPLDNIPSGLSEMALTRLMQERAALDRKMQCYLGAGAYEHFIPAAVWKVATRGEFMTAYTPYQAEASQGSLQLIYEYQTMMASLMALAVSNASMYDGATALAEAVLMSVRLSNKRAKTAILMPKSVNPRYQETVATIVAQQGITILTVPYEVETGQIDIHALKNILHLEKDKIAALVIPQPNFFGVLENVDVLADLAASENIITIAVVNPTAMALLKPPGEWGEKGADIACGEGQPLGIPLAGGGPYYGFLCCKKEHVRQMPGRIVGRTTDKEGKAGFVLTLQAREQHIRRGKATSNICTNQGLMVTASTIYMSLMGPLGLRHVALLCHERARQLKAMLLSIPGITPLFTGPFFHEIALRVPGTAEKVIRSLAKNNIQAGYPLKADYPALGESLLICTTETKTEADLYNLSQALAETSGSMATCLN